MDQEKIQFDKYKIVICGDDPDLDMGKLYHWCRAYEKSKSTLDVYFLSGRTFNYEIRSFWPYKMKNIEDEIYINNIVRSGITANIRNDIHSCMFKMLAFRSVGCCIVLDPMCFIEKQIIPESIPTCDWGVVKQDDKHNDKGLNFYNTFQEFDYVEKTYNAVNIFTYDYSSVFFSLYNKYKNEFYNQPYYPKFCSAIMTLAHKMCNGTFLNDCWCMPCDDTRDALIRYNYTPESYTKIINDEFNVPIVKMLNKYERITNDKN